MGEDHLDGIPGAGDDLDINKGGAVETDDGIIDDELGVRNGAIGSGGEG